MSKKKTARKERRRIMARVRSKLTGQYGVDQNILHNYPILCKYIRKYDPSVVGNGYELLYKFVGEPVPLSRGNRNQQTQTVKSSSVDPASDQFLMTYEWRTLRMVVLKRDGAKCACCGATPADGVTMHVDHIKPRRKFPNLALDANNLQVLCSVCNHGKGNWDETDWRGAHEPIPEEQKSHLRSIK